MRVLSGGAALASGLALSDLSVADLWVRYLQLSGTRTQQELRDYLGGVTQWGSGDHDIAAQALNEYFTDRGLDHPVAYAGEF